MLWLTICSRSRLEPEPSAKTREPAAPETVSLGPASEDPGDKAVAEEGPGRLCGH